MRDYERERERERERDTKTPQQRERERERDVRDRGPVRKLSYKALWRALRRLLVVASANGARSGTT